MKRKILYCVVLLTVVTLASWATSAHALFTPFEEFKIVGANLNTVEKTIFTLDDPSPFLYMKLPNSLAGITVDVSFWTSPSAVTDFVSSGSLLAQERWVSLPDWGVKKEVGDWSVIGSYFNQFGEFTVETTGFSVTPEPVSTLLFLFGSAPIAASLYRKRRRLA